MCRADVSTRAAASYHDCRGRKEKRCTGTLAGTIPPRFTAGDQRDGERLLSRWYTIVMDRYTLDLLKDSERQQREALTSLGSQFDKGLVTLSGGALGLSMTFMKDIVPHPLATHLLYYGWACFALSIVCVFGSLLFAQYSLLQSLHRSSEYMQLLAARYDNSIEKPKSIDTSAHQVPYDRYANWLAIGSLATFVLGIGLLGKFISANMVTP